MFRLFSNRRMWPWLLVSGSACARMARPEVVYLDRVVAPASVAAATDAVMRQYAAEGFTGSVLVASGSRVLLSKGYGDSDRAPQLPDTAEARYPCGPLRDMFTAAALLGLQAERRLRRDQPASDWIGGEGGSVTIGALLPREREAPDRLIRPARCDARSSAVERLRSTGASSALLERVLASAGGEPLQAVVVSRPFASAGLTRTMVDDGRLGDSPVAQGSAGADAATVVVTGLVGPLADLWHWHQALRLGTLLPLVVRQRMQTPAAKSDGMGWVVGRTDGGAPVIEHACAQAGLQLWYGYFPDQDMLILLAVNNALGFRRSIAERLTRLLIPGRVSPAASVVTSTPVAAGG